MSVAGNRSVKSQVCIFNGTVVCTSVHVCKWSKIPSEEKPGVPFKAYRFQNHFFSPMITYPTYHLIWLLLITAGSLKGKRICVSIHTSAHTAYLTDNLVNGFSEENHVQHRGEKKAECTLSETDV